MLAEGWTKFRASLVVQVAALAVLLVAGGAMVVVGIEPVSASIPPSDICSPSGKGMGRCDLCSDPSSCSPEYWDIPDPIPCPDTDWGPC